VRAPLISDDFIAGAIWLVLDEGKTIRAGAHQSDLSPSSLAYLGPGCASRSD
jgi:hypothetical protein